MIANTAAYHFVPIADADALAAELAGTIRRDDMIVCLGAGDITAWAYALPGQLEALAA